MRVWSPVRIPGAPVPAVRPGQRCPRPARRQGGREESHAGLCEGSTPRDSEWHRARGLTEEPAGRGRFAVQGRHGPLAGGAGAAPAGPPSAACWRCRQLLRNALIDLAGRWGPPVLGPGSGRARRAVWGQPTRVSVSAPWDTPVLPRGHSRRVTVSLLCPSRPAPCSSLGDRRRGPSPLRSVPTPSPPSSAPPGSPSPELPPAAQAPVSVRGPGLLPWLGATLLLSAATRGRSGRQPSPQVSPAGPPPPPTTGTGPGPHFPRAEPLPHPRGVGHTIKCVPKGHFSSLCCVSGP